MKNSYRSNNTVVYLIIGGIIYLVLKHWHMSASNDDIRFLTAPTNALISIANQSTWSYSLDHGFAHHSLNILIDKSCSGFNFFLLSANLFLFTLLPSWNSNSSKLLAIPISYIISYVFTLIVNTSRILVSLKLEAIIPIKYSWMHEAQGVFIYLSFLIAAHLTLTFFIRKHTTPNYENIT